MLSLDISQYLHHVSPIVVADFLSFHIEGVMNYFDFFLFLSLQHTALTISSLDLLSTKWFPWKQAKFPRSTI